MVSNWLMQLGDRNPQFIREVKGRLQPRNIVITVSASLLVQGFILAYFWRLAQQVIDHAKSKSGSFKASNLNINWHDWWFEVFYTLTWVALTLLLFLGSYLLIKDIVREERRRTFNFVRLSPASSKSVLLGKLLGVPILLYMAIAAALPLHLWAAVSASLPLPAIVGVYSLSIVSCVFVYTFSLLHSLNWGVKAKFMYVMLLVGIIYAILHGLGLYGVEQYRQIIAATWSGRLISEDWSDDSASMFADLNYLFFGFISFLLISLSTLSVLFWHLCSKRFQHSPLQR